jgi:predicted NBD/HSP70 family sugar kinase
VTVGDAAKTRLLAAIMSAGSISRAELSERTGLSPSRITKVVAPLVESGVVEEIAVAGPSSGPGRPRRLLAVRPRRGVAVGIKLAPSHVTGVLTDMESRILDQATRKLSSSRPDPAMRAMRELCGQLLAHPAAGGIPAMGLGIGVGGHVDSRSGVIVRSAIMGWERVAVADRLSAETGLRVVVNNDVNTLAVAERWFGKGRGVDSFAVVTIGIGIGCGLVLGGELYTGASGIAGEFGHLPVQPGGALCKCGNRGCLEAVASFPAILQSLRDSGVHCRSITQAVRLAREDDTPAGSRARDAFTAAGVALGRGLAGLCNLLNLQKIILSGEGLTAYDLLRSDVDAAWHAHSFSTAADDCELVFDLVDQYLWAKGAACLAIQEIVNSHALLTAQHK